MLQNCSRITKKLTACQIFLPNAAVTGFTVISYFHRLLQSARFRNCNNSSYLPDVSSGPIDEPVSELSGLSSLSRNSWFVESSGRESLLGCWQQSFSLTSSVARVTAEDFPTLEVGKPESEQHEQEGRPVSTESGSVSLNNQTLWDSQFCSSSVKEWDKEEEGNELSSQPSQTDSISAVDKLERASPSKSECSHGNSPRLLQQPLECGVKSIYPKTNSRNYSYPEKSHNSLFYKRDDSVSNHVQVAGASQMDSMLWDELPFSESLNEFLGRIEDGRSIVTSLCPDAEKQARLESRQGGVNLNKSYGRQTLIVGELPKARVWQSFLPPAESDSWENTLFASLQSDANSPSDGMSPCESSSTVLSSAGKECEASCFIPNPHLPALSQSLQVASEPSVPESRHVQSKEANIDISKATCSDTSLQRTAEHGEASCLERSQTAACAHSAHDSCSAGCENKENSSTPSQRIALTFTGPWDSDPATPDNTRRIYKRELKPLTELSENTFKSVNRREVLWNSIFPEGSYNASADLFDVSAGEVAKPVECLNESCNSLTEEDTLTEQVPAPELVLYPGHVPCNSSKPSSFLHRRSPPAFSKHSTPVLSSLCDTECSSVSARDFIPYSQSTPMTKPLQKWWPVGERSSVISTFTPKNPTKTHSKCKRSRASFQNTLLQQLTGRLVKRKRASNREAKESNSSVAQQVLNSQAPASFEEWVPPSANKRFKPAASLNLKTASWAADLQSTRGYNGRNSVSKSKESSENAVCSQNERLKPGDTERILTTPVSACVTKALFLNHTVLETYSPSEGKNLLSSVNYPGVILEGATGWSPELFLQI